ncbi:hypothetical protein CspHIS471_0703910 [Cutaneotrichosporon sp. HIS471]|nr:hypothetical protein CspHIS471_0703910 [Cutaneotrichosporon sp. HIS471]
MTDKPAEKMAEKTAQNMDKMDPPALMVRNPDPTPPATPAIEEDEPELATPTGPIPTSTFHPAAHSPGAATPTSPTATLSHVPTLPPPTHPGRRSPRPPASPEHPRRLPPPMDTSKPAPAVSSPHPRFLAPEPTIQPTSSHPILPSPATIQPPAEDSYIRDPHRLIAYIVPFPTPAGQNPPTRFLVYTPPPPPLLAPSSEGKESKTNKVQRKWQEEVRAAHESNHKVLSWGGIRAKVTRGVDWAVGRVTTADLDFVVRVPKDGEVHRGTTGKASKPASSTAGGSTPITTKSTTQPAQAAEEAAAATADHTSPTVASVSVVGSKEAEATLDRAAEPGSELPAYTPIDEGVAEPSAIDDKATPPALPARHPARHQNTLPIPLPHDEDPSSPESAEPTQATVKLNEMVLIYPPTLHMTEDELKTEFVNSLLRTKSKAQRDTIIATGLLPVTLAIDWALVFVGWVFGGALEVDAVWLASSFRGAKTARSVTKRLTSSDADLKLTFKQSHRADLLQAYLAQRCYEADPNRFEAVKMAPSSYQVLDSIGWEAAGKYDAHNWEEERWERRQVEADLKTTMGKAAGAWRKWCDRYEKDPEKAVKR